MYIGITVPTGLYAALAVSASVFVGVSTALLASDLSGIRSEQDRIYRRIRSIDGRLRGLDDRRDALQESMEDVEEAWEEAEVKEEVDDFIEHAEGNVEWRTVDPISVQVEFAEFIGASSLEEIDERRRRELQDRHEDVENAIVPDRSDALLDTDGDALVDPETAAAHGRPNVQWEIRLDEKYSRTERECLRTETEIRSLRRERRAFVDRYESSSPSEIGGALGAGVVTALLSVLVPLGAYFAQVLGVSPGWVPQSIEVVGVFGAWAIGLGTVFYHLHERALEEAPPLPEEPDLEGSDERREERTEGRDVETGGRPTRTDRAT